MVIQAPHRHVNVSRTPEPLIEPITIDSVESIGRKFNLSSALKNTVQYSVLDKVPDAKDKMKVLGDFDTILGCVGKIDPGKMNIWSATEKTAMNFANSGETLSSVSDLARIAKKAEHVGGTALGAVYSHKNLGSDDETTISLSKKHTANTMLQVSMTADNFRQIGGKSYHQLADILSEGEKRFPGQGGDLFRTFIRGKSSEFTALKSDNLDATTKTFYDGLEKIEPDGHMAYTKIMGSAISNLNPQHNSQLQRISDEIVSDLFRKDVTSAIRRTQKNPDGIIEDQNMWGVRVSTGQDIIDGGKDDVIIRTTDELGRIRGGPLHTYLDQNKPIPEDADMIIRGKGQNRDTYRQIHPDDYQRAIDIYQRTHQR